MGRVLSYSITKTMGGFTQEEKQTMIDVSDKFNSGKYENVWSCENFYLNPYDYYPNWDKFNGCTDGWDAVNKRYEELSKSGLTQIQVCEKLNKEGYILFHHHPNSNKIQGFTKVQGNEFNALLIYLALIELSTLIKDSEIRLKDEGKFLYCPVLIKDGRVKPLLDELIEHINYLSSRIIGNSQYADKIETYGLPEDMINGVDVKRNPYPLENDIGYINESIKDLSELYNELRPYVEAKLHCTYNIQNQYFEPRLLCRKVNVKDFEDTTCNATTLMAGFYGEYWDITDKDAESENYKAIASVQKMLGVENGESKNGLQLEILPKL